MAISCVIGLVALGWGVPAFVLAIGAGVFSLLLRAAVYWGSCPRCGVRFSGDPGGFKAVWEEQECLACGLSLYDRE